MFITDDGNETHSFVLTINFTAIQVLVLVIKPRFVHFFPSFPGANVSLKNIGAQKGGSLDISEWLRAGMLGAGGGTVALNHVTSFDFFV